MEDMQKNILFTIAIDALPQDMENPGKIVIFFMKNNRGHLGVRGLRAGEMVDDSDEKISGDDSKENMMDTSDSQEGDLTDYSRSPLDGLQTDLGNLEQSDEDSGSADDIPGQDASSITDDDDSNEMSSLTTDTLGGTSDNGRDDSKEEIGVLQDGIIPAGNIMEKGDDGRDDSNDDDGDDGVKTTSKELVTGDNFDLPDIINSDIESVQMGEVLATDANRDIEMIDNVQNLNENTDDGLGKDDGEKGQED